MQEVHSHCRPRLQSARSSLHRAAPQASLGREGHSKCLWPVPRVWGCPTLSRLCHPPMLIHQVTRQRYHWHLLSSLFAVNSSLLALPVGGVLPRDPSPVRRLRLIPPCLAGAADHADFFPKIGPQAHPIKQANQGVKSTLESVGVRQGNHDIIRVEEGSLMPTLLSTLAPAPPRPLSLTLPSCASPHPPKN